MDVTYNLSLTSPGVCGGLAERRPCIPKIVLLIRFQHTSRRTGPRKQLYAVEGPFLAWVLGDLGVPEFTKAERKSWVTPAWPHGR